MQFRLGLAALLVSSAFGITPLLASDTPQQDHYVGAQVCAGCHKSIAATQATTAMANTWHGKLSPSLPSDFSVTKKETPEASAAYTVRRTAGGFTYSSPLPEGNVIASQVEEIIGGQRHGLSFLQRIDKVNDFSLDRPALVEGRYAYSPREHALVLSPGFALEKPRTFEDAVGDVLSPTFERKCLVCHGQPDTLGAGKAGGVHCESCHGPAFGHLAAVGKGHPEEGVINPARLSVDGQLKVCGQCHTGFTFQSDPLPDDLLVSNQVTALRNSECFIQSNANLSCMACHNPHEDSPRVAQKTTETCLGCHSASHAPHASVCPVNAASNCIGCHMPAIQKGSFHMTDHWIRVHPEQNVKAIAHGEALRSQLAPVKAFLRLIVVGDHAQAQAAAKRLSGGEAFRQVAHDVSSDPTAPGGGYLGEMDLSQLDAKLAAAARRLSYGETSGVVDLGDRFVILHRLERDFKYDADVLFRQAIDLKARGDLKGAIAKDQQALAVYPYFLRAMIFMGTSLAEAGDVDHASQIFRFASQSFPKDSSAQFNLGLTLANQPAEQIAAFERALDLDPDMIPVYESLGAALYSAGKPQEATDAFRKGLLVDPLSAKLNYNLGLALVQSGDAAEGKRRMALAAQADPSVADGKGAPSH